MSGNERRRPDSGEREATATVDLRDRLAGEWFVTYIVTEARVQINTCDGNSVWFILSEGESLQVVARETTLQVRAAGRGRVLSEETIERAIELAQSHEGHRQDSQQRNQSGTRRDNEFPGVNAAESAGRGESRGGDGD